MPRKSSKQKHLDKAEVIGSYGDAFKKWRWLVFPAVVALVGNSAVKKVFDILLSHIFP
ncbi:hypothetical protein [Persicitalea jodogahamensis]|uniref:hypothetical protein n=1 Tax=Persicitalea jodogahamensis TaxID=402147 RepID=UPI0016768C5A|nr:hypothetical protein [Persicitalea jodogahamensis]